MDFKSDFGISLYIIYIHLQKTARLLQQTSCFNEFKQFIYDVKTTEYLNHR